MVLNEFDQPVGDLVPNWQPAPFPPHVTLSGWDCRVEPLNPAAHGAALWQAFSEDSGALWTYFAEGPFASQADFLAYLAQRAAANDPQFYAIVDATSGLALGLAAYLRIEPAVGVIEVGYLHFSPALQGTRLATAAMVLMMQNAFALGYRRYEWKCNALNAPSRRAALRLGFQFEGVFRQARVSKGRNRDTAWFSILDGEWPALSAVYARWLAADNFDAAGQQRLALSSLTQSIDRELNNGVRTDSPL
ncbi:MULTISPECIES: GNAT family N-acetyltransferase [Deefgea]|uniref:GNAT family N-acetyltransferase n=1 Tax=Deefgea chitinilytica TaxID=570276 RepID=A0ABS2CDM0_9NEIS|nr:MULTISPECIES: GNAT family protein [Deefgea]MBM5572219.1 GNAT family N-acetyltransferase [Deefgea chitinilytica]MBM9889454.1 GNAT family N-acetyltransferase [Deefgea sp. CFH1-16]